MPRVRPPDGFARLLEAAFVVFGQRGIKSARMADVAAEMGVSQGTLYNYVESKEALFLLVITTKDPEAVGLPTKLPVPRPTDAELVSVVKRVIEERTKFEALERAVRRRQPPDPREELRGVVTELYTVIHRERHALRVLEASAVEFGELFGAWFLGRRRQLFATITTYVKKRARAGCFRPLVNPDLAARALLEMIVYMARDIPSDPDPDHRQYGADELLGTVVELCQAALIPDDR